MKLIRDLSQHLIKGKLEQCMRITVKKKIVTFSGPRELHLF